MNITLTKAREIALRVAARHGVTVVTPDHTDMERESVLLAISASSDMSLAETRLRVSFYVPKILDDVRALVPSSVRPLLTGSAIFISADGWGHTDADAATVLGIMAHELGHHNRDEATRLAQGIIGSFLWGVAYIGHPTVRGYEESTCYLCDLTMSVVITGAAPAEMRDRMMDSLRHYRLSAQGTKLANRVLSSGARSLVARQLPGVNNTAHEMLKELVADGWDPGPWRAAIVGSP